MSEDYFLEHWNVKPVDIPKTSITLIISGAKAEQVICCVFVASKLLEVLQSEEDEYCWQFPSHRIFKHFPG